MSVNLIGLNNSSIILSISPSCTYLMKEILSKELSDLLACIKRREDNFLLLLDFAGRKMVAKQQQRYDGDQVIRLFKENQRNQSELRPIQDGIFGTQMDRMVQTEAKSNFKVVQLFQAVQQKFKASPLWSIQQNQLFRNLFSQLEKATLSVDLPKFKEAVVTFSRNKIAKQISFLTTIKQKIQDFDLIDYRKIYKPAKKQEPKSQSTISPPKHVSPQRLRKNSPSKEQNDKRQEKVRQARLALQEKQKLKRAKMQFINKIIMKNYSMMDLCRQNLLQNLMTEGQEEKLKLGERLMVRNQENAVLIHNYSMKSMADREAKIAIQMAKFRQRIERQRERQQQRLLKARLAEEQRRKKQQKQFQKSLVIGNQQKAKQPKKNQRYSLEKVVQRIPDLNFSFNRDRGVSLNQHVNQFKTVNMSAGAQMQVKAVDQRKIRIQCMRRTQIFAKDKKKDHSSSPIQRWLNRESFKISSVLLNNHQQVQKVNVTQNERLDIRYYQNNDKRLGDLRTRLKFKENRLYIQ